MSNEEQHKIVNVHGVRFDISSILNDVTASIQNNIKKSLDGALKDYELYKSTHDAILQIPFVRELYIQNQELISQLEMLEHPNSHSQPIQLKIDELSPQSSPMVMHSYFQIDSHDDNPFTKNTNKILSSDSEGEEEDLEESEESEELEELEEEVSASEKEEEEEEVSASEKEEEEEEVSANEEEEEEEVSANEEEEEEEVSANEEEEQEEEVSANEEEEQEEEVSANEEEEQEEEEEEQEEEEEEQEEQEEEQEEQEEEEEEEEEGEEEEEEEGEEVYEIVIKNITYFTTNENDGDIYSCVDGDVGEIVGKFKNKKPSFMKRK
jgi:hypothetical protein